MGNIELTDVMLILATFLITLLFARYYYGKSSKDLPRLVKRLAPNKETTPEKAAAKLLLELVCAWEKNKIYWREFVVITQAMIKAGNMANETIEHISLSASKRAVSDRPPYYEMQDEIRKIEIPKLRQTLEERLKQ